MTPLDIAQTEYIYTPLSAIQKELENRRNDSALVKKVEDFLGDMLIKEFCSEPCAVLSRTISTPNFEYAYFKDIVSTMGMQPLVLEYDGKFVSKNIEKYHLCRLFFSKQLGVRRLYESKSIVNFNTSEGKNFSEITTHWGEPIIDFHKRLVEYVYPNDTSVKTLSFSEWFNKARTMNEFYYLLYLAHFVCHGVLFENFLLQDDDERDFFKNKVLPSFKKIEEIFGVKPLIFPLLPIEEEKAIHWLSYPDSLKEYIINTIPVK